MALGGAEGKVGKFGAESVCGCEAGKFEAAAVDAEITELRGGGGKGIPGLERRGGEWLPPLGGLEPL